MTIVTIDGLCDSEGAGTLFSCAQPQGGKGNWSELSSQYLGAIPGLGPVISPGARFVHLALMPFPTSEFSYAGSWTAVVAADAHDRLPHGYGKYGSGATLVLTWNVQPGWAPITCFDMWWVDLASGGDISYRIDGGAWTNFGQTRNGNGKLSKFFVNSAVTSTIEIRMANAAGTAQLGFPAGITPYYTDPRSATTGVVWNNFGANGATLHGLLGSTGGDRLAVLDDVQLGTGSPISSNPTIALMLFVNDIPRANDTEWGTDETTLATRLNLGTKFVMIGPWAIETADYDLTQQGLYRAKTSAIATSTGSTFLDVNAAWVARGLADVTAQGAAFLADDLHPKQAGHYAIADLVTGVIRNKCLTTTVGGNVNAFTVGTSYVGPSNALGGFAQGIIPLTSADTSTATEAGALAATTADTETSSAADTEQAAATLSDADAATSADDGTITAPTADTDTATSLDAGEQLATAVTDDEPSTGTDAGETIAAATGDGETSSATDAGESNAQTDNDTSTVTDAGETIAATAADAETSTATDAGEQLALSDTDTGSGADAEQITAALADADTSTVTDAGESVSATLIDDDTGSAADAGAIAPLAVSEADTGTGTDAGETIAASTADMDTSSATDAETIAAAVPDVDAGATSDAEAITVAISDADTAVVIEAELILAAAVADLDTGSSTEAGSVTPDSGTVVNKTDGDAGTAFDAGTVSLFRNLELQFSQPAARWAFSEPSPRWIFEGAES